MALIRGPNRDDVYLIELDPTRGSEIPKTVQCVVAQHHGILNPSDTRTLGLSDGSSGPTESTRRVTL